MGDPREIPRPSNPLIISPYVTRVVSASRFATRPARRSTTVEDVNFLASNQHFTKSVETRRLWDSLEY